MIIDAHTHIFNSGVIGNVAAKTEMAKKLCLETEEAHERVTVKSLESRMQEAGVEACLILPTANASNIRKMNNNFFEITKSSGHIHTAGTLHPDYKENGGELALFKKRGIRAIKMCSFSQGFVLNDPETIALLDMISNENRNNNAGFFVILDTLYDADTFFGTMRKYNTTPALLGNLVKGFPYIKFIGAHMGGLNAPFREIDKYLPASDNFYMDTSNAAHTLSENEFVHLLKKHGPEHIAFGTDWPWFGYTHEIKLIEKLLGRAGYSEKQKASVFRGSIAKLLGI